MSPSAAADSGKFTPAGERDPFAQAKADSRRFHTAARRELDRYVLRGFERDELLTALGYRGATERLLASNKRVRKRAAEILVGEFADLRQLSVSRPELRFWHFSFLGPMRPMFEWKSLKPCVARLEGKLPLLLKQ